jgi:diaminohydroxyphosphoribosylaminopyrimidine deaminase/5-amino-6-(5-phosphoribosylamino)uracil reductase
MRHALRLAERGLGRVAPNPAVGCIIVADDGRIVGRGWTAPGGRPHAETIALSAAGAAARDATAYVTLEPCAHHGKTRPCAEALIAAGVARVVVAVGDPDPRVNGEGFAILRTAGIEVREGVCAEEARVLNAGFFSRVEKGRPLVALKIAESADGFVGASGTKWVTEEAARRHGHLLRATHDAIIAGIGTVLADDPLLTCRLEGMEDRSPIRIVIDSHLRLPAASLIVKSARDVPVLVFTTVEGAIDGIEVLRVTADANGKVSLQAVMQNLAQRGLTRVLVEGGPELQRALAAAGLADRVYRYLSPRALGSGVLSAFGAVKDRIHIIERLALGPDLLESYALSS